MTANVTDNEKNNTSAINDFFMKMGVLGELMAFLWKRKLYWLIPMMITLMLFAVIIIAGGSGAGGLFIYSLF